MVSALLRALRSFRELFIAFWKYQLMVLRLICRARLSLDLALIMAVEGLMRRSEVKCLYELAKIAPDGGVIVEIGSYRGLSTVALAMGAAKGKGNYVYSIDPHDFLDKGNHSCSEGFRFDMNDNVAFLRNLLFAGVGHVVKPITLFSYQVAPTWDKPISLLWIDGNHEYEAVQKDWNMWKGFVLPGGYVAFHDSSDPGTGPYRVVQQAIKESDFVLLKRVEKVTVLQRIC